MYELVAQTFRWANSRVIWTKIDENRFCGPELPIEEIVFKIVLEGPKNVLDIVKDVNH